MIFCLAVLEKKKVHSDEISISKKTSQYLSPVGEPGLPISIAFGPGVDPVFLYGIAFGSADYTHLGCVLELAFFFMFSQTFVVSINLEIEKLLNLIGRGLANGTFAVLFFPREWSRRYE